MATTIKLKRGTTTPTTSNIVDGELGIDTSAQKIYINDSGTIKELGGVGSSISDLTTATGEPMGHADRTESTIAFDTSTRIYSITPVSTSFDVWCAGTKYTYSSAQTVTLPTTSGLYYIYFDSSGVLSYKTTYFTWHEETPTSYVYYNADSASESFFFDERHGITLDWQTHEYLHRTRGAVLANGLSASYYGTLSTNDGSSDDHYKVKISNGTFFDEDLEVNVTHAATPTGVFEQYTNPSTGGGKFPVLYKIGSSGLWRKSTGANVTEAPYRISSSVPQYNLDTAGTWSLANVGNNKFFGMWLVATNTAYSPIVAIAGQEIYDNLTQAKNNEVWTALNLSDLPLVEYRPLYRLIFEYNSTYTNTGKTALRDMLDVRALPSQTSTGVVQNDHGNLFGLGDDDHPQYVHVDNARTITADHTFTGDLTFSGNVSTNQIYVNAGYDVIFEGTTDDAFETTLTGGDPTADRTIDLPDKSGTVALLSDVTTLGVEDILSFSTTLSHSLDNPNTYTSTERYSDYFGKSVDIDGSYLVVGTPNEKDSTDTYSNSGIVYVYDLSSATPTTPIHVLDNPNTSGTPTNDYFGQTVSISGNYIVVGAVGSDGGTSGHVYVYDLTSGTPTTPIHTLTNPNLYGTSTADFFGQKAVVEGNYVVVGAIGDNSFQGTIYIYDLSSATPTTPIHQITNPNNYDGSGNTDYFSLAFDISGDVLVVSAPYEDETSSDDNNGVAYIFDLASATPTTPIHTIPNPNNYSASTPDTNDYFGDSIAIDGNIVLIGSTNDEIDSSTSSPGVVHVFDLSSSDPTVPTKTLLNPSPSSDDRFGFSVAIKGNYAVIGTYNTTSSNDVGEVYVFDITSGSLVKTLTNPNSQTYDSIDRFGYAVAINDDYLIASAPEEDYFDYGTYTVIGDSGKVYVYSIGSGNYIPTNYINDYVGPANSTTAGVAGLVPASASSDYNTNKYLKVDGTWATVVVQDDSFINSIIFG